MGLEVTEALNLPESELQFETSRSSGPGGQNVNKVETRVTVVFDAAGSPTLAALEEPVRRRLLERLAPRLTKDGVLRISSQRHRSQSANREDAVARLVALLAAGLAPRRRRKKTRPTAGARRRRLESKRRRGQIKSGRRSPGHPDD